ncbi:phytanoyl-CoA dioxygenase family protein [Nannocystis pusilla]|uniref:phytanoyl-CoA dioxygenase family protein n=1 Tax=Nannocystis pusilla TaxID=889268 RepID=UPI003BF3715A
MSHPTVPTSLTTEAERADFRRDGAVCLRQRFDATWVARLREAVDEQIDTWESTVEYTPRGRPGRYVSTLFMWLRHATFREFAFQSPAAAIAAELMGATKINLFADQVLVKEPGTLDPTLWHHDLPFWPLAGTQVCSIWLALDPVTPATGGIEFVAGSHRWPYRFRPLSYFAPEMASKRNMDLPACPSFDERRAVYRILSWDLEPGDCVVFDSLVIHGSGGNMSSDVRRRGVATRWCGDDVTFLSGDFVLALPTDPDISDGDALDSALFPVVWQRPR